MTTKQLPGVYAPDGSLYITLTDGAGTLVSTADVDNIVTPESFGAIANGVHDDTVALQAAINHAQTTGLPLFLNKVYSVSQNASTGYCVNITSLIKIYGSGRISPFDTVASTVDILRITSTAGAAAFTSISGISLGAISGSRIGRHGIYIDNRIAGNYIGNLTIDNVNIGLVNGWAIYQENVTVNNVNGGLYTSVISNSILAGGVRLINTGDSIRIFNNTMYGTNTGVRFDQTAGAAQISITENNITTPNGSIICEAGTQLLIAHNQMELIGGSGSVNGAQVDLASLSADCTSAVVRDNNINVNVVGGTVTANIRIGTIGSTNNKIYDNVFSSTNTSQLASGYALNNLLATGTVWGNNVVNSTYVAGNIHNTGSVIRNDQFGVGTSSNAKGSPLTLTGTSGTNTGFLNFSDGTNTRQIYLNNANKTLVIGGASPNVTLGSDDGVMTVGATSAPLSRLNVLSRQTTAADGAQIAVNNTYLGNPDSIFGGTYSDNFLIWNSVAGGTIGLYANGNVTPDLLVGNANITVNGTISPTVDRSLVFTNQTSAGAAQVGTITNAPASGNPGHWLKIKVGGTNYSIPCWLG